MPLTKLYPEIDPFSQGFEHVTDVHTLYWELSGNEAGDPVIYLHGGPGAGSSPQFRRFFDPDHYQVLIYDQRGCGKSTPTGSLEDIGLAAQIADIKHLADKFGFKRFHLYGGSWGATLALAFAAMYPERVKSLMLRGIFLMETRDIHWFLKGNQALFPDAHDQFIEGLPRDQRHDPEHILKAYYAQMTCGEKQREISAAVSWASMEDYLIKLYPEPSNYVLEEKRLDAWVIARQEAHYFLYERFDDKNNLRTKIDRFRHIPTSIAHGRYDVITPLENSYLLTKYWPEADLRIIPDAGHASLDPPLRSALVEMTDQHRTIQ